MKSLFQYGLLFVFLFQQSHCGKLESDVFGSCVDYCTSSKINEAINLAKHPNALFKKCPQTARVCLEGGSHTMLGDTSAIFVENYSSLKVSEYGLLSLADNAFCDIKSHGELEIGKLGKLNIRNGRLIVEGNSKFDNQGTTKMEPETELTISDFSQLNNLGSRLLTGTNRTPAGEINLAKKSTINLKSHSVLMVKDQCRLNLSENAEVRLEAGSNLNLHLVSLNMKTRARLLLNKFTTFQAGDPDMCYGGYENANKPNTIVFHELAVLLAKEFSHMHLITGQLVLNQSAALILLDNAKLTVDGMFEIGGGNVSVSGWLKIGERVEYDSLVMCHGHSSLIVPGRNMQITLEDVTVKENAHCYVKKGVSDSERSKVMLIYSSDTAGFKCFDSRSELIDAIENY